MTKQISLTLPENLFDASKKYSQDMGYRSTQEFIVELVRRKIFFEKEKRYMTWEAEMDRDKTTKTHRTKRSALEHLDRL